MLLASSQKPWLRHGTRHAYLSSKSFYSILCSVAGSASFSSSSSPYFPYCFPPSHRTLVFANYLRSHFFVSQPKPLRCRVRRYLSELRRISCPKNSYSSSCSMLTSTEFLAAAANLSSSRAAYQILKHLTCSGMDFLLLIFNLSRSLHFFPSV